MTRINPSLSTSAAKFLAWGKQSWGKNAGAFVFAAVLIICSVTVGCSSDKPKPASSNTQLPVAQTLAPVSPAPVMQAESKPAPKKIVHKKPATVNYTDKMTGVSFEYPRRYAIETGDAAADLLQSSPIPMNFVAPGGVALAAVELPETSFANTDFSNAFFNVSVHKNLTADQCNEFAVPAPKLLETKAVEAAPGEAKPIEQKIVEEKPADNSSAAAAANANQPDAPAQTATTAVVANGAEKAGSLTSSVAQSPAAEPQGSKLLLGDLELRATEAVSGEGTRQSDSKYFHVYQNGSCYEFALNVTTVASADGLIKHVDRDKVFDRLEKILDTVKISPVAPEATAEAPATPATAASPAQ